MLPFKIDSALSCLGSLEEKEGKGIGAGNYTLHISLSCSPFIHYTETLPKRMCILDGAAIF